MMSSFRCMSHFPFLKMISDRLYVSRARRSTIAFAKPRLFSSRKEVGIRILCPERRRQATNTLRVVLRTINSHCLCCELVHVDNVLFYTGHFFVPIQLPSAQEDNAATPRLHEQRSDHEVANISRCTQDSRSKPRHRAAYPMYSGQKAKRVRDTTSEPTSALFFWMHRSQLLYSKLYRYLEYNLGGTRINCTILSTLSEGIYALCFAEYCFALLLVNPRGCAERVRGKH